jgi:hypothetical protein
VSLLVTSLLVASGVLVGRWVARSSKPKTAAAPMAPKGAERPEAPPTPSAMVPDLADFPCQLGDVVLRVGEDEAWLAGALVLSEESVLAAVFVAPDAGGDRAVVAKPAPAQEIVWAAPIDAASLGASDEPPGVLEHEGERFERSRRLPVRVHRLGSGAPDLGATAVLAEYAAASGERVLWLKGHGKPHAWRGVVLDPGTFDVLPGGKSTLG